MTLSYIPSDTNAEGILKAAASGTLPNGKPVVVNADGTVSVVAETSVSAALGSSAQADSGASANAYVGAAYDTSSQKVVIVYRDATNSNYGTAAVGTISGTSISFVTPVVFESSNSNWNQILYDSAAGKLVIAYSGTGSSLGYARVATVSGTSISFGTRVQFESGITADINMSYDTSSQKVVIAYRDGGNSQYGTAIVGTVSGTDISFGSSVLFNASHSRFISLAYDANANKTVVACRDVGNSSHGKAFVGTISETSISFGSGVVFNAATTYAIDIVYDPPSQKVIVSYQDVGNSSYGTAKVGTISGTSISFGNASVFNEASTASHSLVYTPNSQKVLIAYQDAGAAGRIKIATISGTTVAFSSATTFNSSNSSYINAVYDSNGEKAVIAYTDAGSSPAKAITGIVYQNAYTSTTLTAENYIGMSSGVVVVNSVAQALGSEVVFESASSYANSATFDSNSNKIVIAYRDGGNSSYGTAIVGTVSDTSISFGSAVVFETTSTTYISAAFDSNSNKVVIAYRSSVGNAAHAIVGTVNDTSISFGNRQSITGASTTYISAAFDSSNNKVVVAYRDNAVSPQKGKVKVGTVSGTSISFGSETIFNAGVTDWITTTFDSSNNKVVICYRDVAASPYPGTAIVGTVSGTSISFGSETVFQSANCVRISSTFDSSNNKVVITYQNAGNSSYFTAIVGTVSGTSISFGSSVVFSSASGSYNSAIFDSNSNKIVIAYRDGGNSNYGTAIVGTVSGTSISFGSAVVLNSANTYEISTTFDSNSNKVVIAYLDEGNSNYGTSIVLQPGFTDITRGEVPSGSQAITDIIGSVSSIQTGLTAGQSYFVQTDGTIGLTADDPSVFAGTAISATKLLVKT